MEALVSAGLGRLAASPMRLKTVARNWQDTGDLAASQLEAIRLEIDHLLQETSDRWPKPAVPDDRRRRLAGRLAAMMMFGKAGRFTAGPRHLPGTLNLGRLPSAPEADEPGQDVTPAEYEEVLGTALFDVAADSTVVFRHQQYAEFLAAEYVTGRPVTRGQLPVLLGMADDGTIPGSLAGITAWIAVLDPELAEGLARANALVLAKTGVEFPSHAYRAAVVDGILAKAASGDADPLPVQDLTALAHAGLEEQLAGHLGRDLTWPQELWWIAVLAEAGGCRDLAHDLTRHVVDAAWPTWARRAGLSAVAALGDDQDLLRLKDLARLGPDSDPVDSVLAGVIGALFPRLMGTAEVLTLLRPARNADSIGPYSELLSQLSTRIPARRPSLCAGLGSRPRAGRRGRLRRPASPARPARMGIGGIAGHPRAARPPHRRPGQPPRLAALAHRRATCPGSARIPQSAGRSRWPSPGTWHRGTLTAC